MVSSLSRNLRADSIPDHSSCNHYQITLHDTQFIISAAQKLGFRDQDPSVTFLGYDLVEPRSFWSVLTHTTEWGSELFHGNEYGLCSTLDDVQTWLQQYSRSDDTFKLPADENSIVALYQLVEV